MINKIYAFIIGIVIIAIGATLITGIMTQTATVDKNKNEVITPGIIPIGIPTSLFGFSTLLVGGIVAALGVGLILFGFQFGY